jgi:hypothetical protein
MNTEERVRTVADRHPVDIEGLRDQIENAYPQDTFWADLSMSQKIRKLIQLGLDQLKKEQSKK